ncbi:MAG: universal stress protein [Candidatus Parcubacteria bacterium]|jgi:nucleotide-binding universal stress UspA family protein|uniref:universal stress protein n=1 Tax=Phormidesmis priestleyi TaxID=268141 RepID=UPI00083AA761|nr:universal stress protein [Phormidesmis priestleyi]MBC7824476.1 universal stress protein [Leptolyngbyaceae cyanobacterium LF-bin-113]
MFQKILAAIDSSTIGQQVFDESIAIAKWSDASLMLLHVLSNEEEGSPVLPIYAVASPYPLTLEGYPNPLDFDVFREQWKSYEQKGLALLKTFTDEAIAAGVRAEFTQSQGNPSRTICDLARTWEADHIVIGRRGHSGLSELFLGSVSNYVLHHASCSVLTVQTILAKPDPS